LEKEVIFSEDLEEIFGKRPWDTKHVIPENGDDNPEEIVAETNTETPEQPEENKENDTDKK